MQCSHSRHANIIQVWSYICNKTIFVYIDANITSIKTFQKCSKNGKHELHAIVYVKKTQVLFNFKRPLFQTIFISNHAMCSLISSYCCNHLNSMLMSVKLIMIHLELNDIGYKFVFHSYSKSTSNTWYILICKFEKCKPNFKKITWVWTYIICWISFSKREIEKNWKKRKERK